MQQRATYGKGAPPTHVAACQARVTQVLLPIPPELETPKLLRAPYISIIPTGLTVSL